MPSFETLMRLARARNRDKDEHTSKRFLELLEVLRKYHVRDGITPDEAVALLEDLGTTFVKLGQIASTHPDVLPREYCDAFGKLRAHAKPLDAAIVKKQIEDELGKPVDELFEEFDDTPVGSASIAQVHRAVVKDSKQVVAVKVQRPGVVEQVTDDLSIMERIVELYDLLSPSEGRISFKQLVDELVRTSRDELDFRIEARNLERFYENNKDRPGIGSPRCYEELTTRALLTEDFFTDPRVGEPSAVEGLSGEERDQLAYLIANNYMQQLMEDGFFHADPHAGNILITAEHGIRWIDFGMMGEMNGREREVLGEIIESLIKGDAYGLKRSLLKVATPTGPVDHGALLGACENIISEVIDVDLESFDTGAVFDELAESMRKSGFELAPFLVTMGRGLVTLEGTIKLVSDKLNIMQVLAKYAADSFTPEKIARRARKVVGSSVESVEAMAALPSKAMDTLDMLQKGQVRLGMNMDVNKKVVSALRESINNFAFALLAAAMIIGSCVLCTTELEPQILGIPALGFAGFIFGTALMVYISALILRSKDRDLK